LYNPLITNLLLYSRNARLLGFNWKFLLKAIQ